MPSQRQRLVALGVGALSMPLALASGCSYDERRLRITEGAERAGTAGDPSSGAGESEPGDAGASGESNTGGVLQVAGTAGTAGNAGVAGTAGSNPTGGAGGNAGSAAAGASGSGAGTGGAASGGTANGGAPNGGAPNGGAPNGGTAGAFNGPCGDLDGNAVDDCSETLVQNSRFDLDLSHWTAEPQITSAWDAQNASPTTGSGSARLLNVAPVASAIGLTMAGAEQCILVTGAASYEVAARVMIPSGQGQGEAGFNLWVFGADDCKSNFLVAVTPVTTQATGAWTIINGDAKLPAGAKSMTVRLVALKPFAQAQLQASFDDVLVRQH